MKNIFRIELDPKRIFGLDILRALAILFVVIEHTKFLLPQKRRMLSDLFNFDGVSIFFVLSGFLIGGILIRIIEKNGINKRVLLDFWVRRWFRTLPNYFLILIILFFLNFYFTEDFDAKGVWSYIIFSQNLLKPHPNFFPEAWSLSVEEWFYLTVPILIALFKLILKATNKNVILYTSIIVVFVVTYFRFYRFSTISLETFEEWDVLFRKQVTTRLDSLMFGVIGAYISFYYNQIWLKYKNHFALFGIFLFIFSRFLTPPFVQVNEIYYCVFSFTLISIATLLVLPYCSNFKEGKGYLYKSISYISVISYSIYLLNLSIIRFWIIDKINWNYFTNNGYLIIVSKYVLSWLLLFLLSILLYKYFEKPMTKLRENFRRRNTIEDNEIAEESRLAK